MALAQAGRWSEVTASIDGLSASQSKANPQFRLLRAEACLRLGSLHEAVDLANTLLADETLDAEVKARAFLVRSAACRLRGFVEAAAQDAGAALALLQGASAPVELRVEGHRQLGAAFGTMGHLDEAVRHLEDALALCSRSSDLGLLASVHNNLAIALAQLGQLPAAQVNFDRARAAFRKLANKPSLAGVLNNLGRLYYDLGQHETSLIHLHEARRLARQGNYQRLEATALVSIGDTLQRLGRYEEALESHQAALALVDQVLEPRLACCANIGIGSAWSSLRDFGKAKLVLTQAVYEARKLNLKYEHAVATLHLGIVDLNEGNPKRAAEQVLKAVGLLESSGASRELLKAYLHLCLACLRTGQWTRLRGCLKTLAKMAEELDLRDQLAVEAAAVPEVIEYAASTGIARSLFLEIEARLRGKRTEPGDDVGDKAASHTLGTPLPRVEVYGLGKSAILVEGRNVGETEWRSQKAKELFLYLLSHRKETTREQLLAVLWPDVSGALSRNAFYNNVYRLRKALYSDCVLQHDGRYQLNPEASFWFDVEEFRELAGDAAKLPRGSQERAARLEKAVRLYRGSFLEDFYAEWCGTIRLQAEAQYLQSLASLAGFHAAQGNHGTAIEFLEKLLIVDPLNEEGNEQLVKALLTQGDLAAAHHRYTGYLSLVEQELGVKPSKSFQQLCAEAGVAN